MGFDGDDVGGGGGEVAGVVDVVTANCPAYVFRFCFLGATGAYDSDVGGFFVWHSCPHSLR